MMNLIYYNRILNKISNEEIDKKHFDDLDNIFYKFLKIVSVNEGGFILHIIIND